MTTKHTPGPWAQVGTDVVTDNFLIAACGERNNPVAKANARMIAAAPELLDALIAMQKAFDQLLPGIGKIACQDYANINEAPIFAARAIAKAKGQQ
jgi:hypothetical protein